MTSGIDTYLVCPDHGDVFVHRDAGPGHPVAQAHEVVPLRGDVAQPRTGDAMRCPLCGADLHVEHRQRAGA